MSDMALAICLAGLAFAAGLGLLLGWEPAWLTRWLFPAAEEVPTTEPASEPVIAS